MPHPLLPAVTEAGVIATLRAPDADSASFAVETLVDAGVTAVEITYTTPGAGVVITEVARRFGDAVLVGAGTVTRADQVHEAAEAGARFLVSPGLDEAVLAAMRQTAALTMVGGFTPTEVQRLAALEVDVVKLFPGSLGGPGVLRALRGPFPDLVYVPTGGVSVDNVAAWFAAGAAAVGAASELAPAAAIRDRDAQTLRANAAAFLTAVAQARTGRSAA
ncbi:2-dehydro-3-deoxyphosphogluconate aldolase [Xylanimonas oleitrophica]|uniref:2-dehydro-3-deoxyphosphogluconate aldolase n=1 Tax=Xylanimonas oleitrophica TaxID=2607479 RepID=A0A2W5X316_9MICO|nr:bifunctional 4-hydroxy-2-oxoglutarate aldolase/2-dehydro-3-deoxy-phosphogluconate aldolase [Xylanimonas oleitrophica]PZR55326.1 2-dehydro-3-deoxyphosphogluconate aldolase [Xylanimonas oleitrophica]